MGGSLMSEVSDLLADILDYSPTEKGEERRNSPMISPSENVLNSAFSPNSPNSPTMPLRSSSPPEMIAALKAEERRQKVLSMLVENPNKQRAYITDDVANSENVILTVAIRDFVSFEMLIPKKKYDPFLFIELINKENQ
jgi:pseudouridine-5'-phosphate glycosidase